MQVFNSAHHSFTYGSPNSDIGTKSTSSRIGKEGKKIHVLPDSIQRPQDNTGRPKLGNKAKVSLAITDTVFCLEGRGVVGRNENTS